MTRPITVALAVVAVCLMAAPASHAASKRGWMLDRDLDFGPMKGQVVGKVCGADHFGVWRFSGRSRVPRFGTLRLRWHATILADGVARRLYLDSARGTMLRRLPPKMRRLAIKMMREMIAEFRVRWYGLGPDDQVLFFSGPGIDEENDGMVPFKPRATRRCRD